jgi:ADP-heptose:LPS heptosyltransferase
MNVAFQRKVDRTLGGFICKVISLFVRKPKEDSSAARPGRILVILLSEMGSLILGYPMFQRIRNRYADATLHVLLLKRNREALELLDVVEPEHILTISDESIITLMTGSMRMLLKLRRIKFDVAIDCELFARISSIFSFFSGAKIRVGFHPYTQEGLYRGDFINRPVPYNPYHHISQQFLTLVEAIDSVTVPTAKRLVEPEALKAPPAKIGQGEIAGMRNRLYEDFRDIRDRRLVFIYPSGGLLPIRAWPVDYFCQVAQDLLSRGHAVAVIGLKSDRHLGRTLLSHCRNPCCIDLTGYTKSVRELMILFYLGALLITNDGGPGQFAAMTPIPTIIFFGPETPVLYRPMDEKAVIFHTPLSCSPCLTAYNHRNSPCDGDNVCLKSIQPDQVLERALEILVSQEKASGEG